MPLKWKQYFFLLLLGIYAFFSWQMLLITFQYIPFDLDVAFLRIKQDYISLWHYRVAFFTHVYTAAFVLIAGFTQFLPSFRRNNPVVHRISGYVYIVTVLVFAAPSGFVMGWYANGGFSSQLAFSLLAILWFYFTYAALCAIRKHKIAEHQNFMIRSFALTLSAITLRAWKYFIVAIFQPKPMDVYRIVAWLGWVLNLLIAEYIIYRKKK